jgi:phage gpG-like protein
MSKSNKFNLKQAEKKARKAMEAAIVDVGNTAKTFFRQAFVKQGFEDKSVVRWQKRKVFEKKGRGKFAKNDDGKRDKSVVRSVKAGRGILVKSGDLQKSIIRNPENRAALTVKISTDLDYAKIHNDGLMGKAWGKHPFKMPKRQFMGDSYNLNEKVKAVIVKRLDKIFT